MKTKQLFQGKVPLFTLLLVVALATVLASASSAFATGTPVLSSGYQPTATNKAAVRYRSFNSGTGGEVYLGLPGLSSRAEIDFYRGATCDGATPYGAWQASNHIKFSYDPSTGKIRTEVQASHLYCKEYPVGNLGALNYIKISIANRGTGTTVNLNNIMLDGSSLGNLVGSEFTDWQVTGADLSAGFTLEGDIVLAGAQPGGENNKIDFVVGYYVPPDTTGPIASNVVASPNPAFLNGSATVTAAVDDTTTGGATIASAEYSLNGSAWTAVTAADGAFDEVSEDVTASFTAATVGTNTVCVRAKDALNNVGDETCATFVVTYAFNGFFQPIDNNVVNTAKAGQAIPAKWRLTDANGVAISNPASFAGLYSYPVSCSDFTGSPTDAVEEYAPGASGLQYAGNGYWQFNWKTPKTYANTCRAMYVEFNSSATSPVVNFQFK